MENSNHKKYCLFIGRYQPLHKGHITLIRSVLNEGKNVAVGLTPSETDPFSVEERLRMFFEEFEDEIKSGRMVVFPIVDIEAVCYGRKVGYDIREIRLPEEIEAISATKIRNGEIVNG